MSGAALNIFVRVVVKRIENGESLDEILDGYTKLSDEEKAQIRKYLSNI